MTPEQPEQDAQLIVRQQEASMQVGQQLWGFLTQSPAEFTSLQYSCRHLGRMSQATLLGIRNDGSEGWNGLPRTNYEFGKAVDELRASIYRSGQGTWFSAMISVSRQGGVSMKFDHDNEPDFGREVPAHLFVTDQENFPRDAEHIPDWLAAKHEEGRKNPPPAPRTYVKR